MLTGLAAGLQAATYHVAQTAAASDENAGTEAAPWKTVSRAASAKELKPGDTVLIHSGVYRESVAVAASGEPGQPITFAAAPQERVVIKGSEIVKGRWTRLGDLRQQQPDFKEPFPHAFRRVWKIRLGDEFFTDARFQGSYADKSRRWVSQFFLDDDHPLQMIGPDPIYTNKDFGQLTTIGQGLADMIPQSFYFDPKDQTLDLCMGGEPGWFCVEVGVRGFALTAENVLDVVIRGLEMRHNRQPGGQWAAVSIGQCEHVVVEDCKIHFADFNGLSLHRCKDCAVRRCDLSYNGCTGMALGLTEDCLVEDCTLLFNNYRRFDGDWGVAAGMKNIPGNRRTTIRRCEAAYNIYADNTWTPWMRHNWNDNNALAQWQSRFGQGLHSRLARIEYQRVGTQFRLLTQDGLDVAGPLPEEVTQIWRPQNPKRVGADLTQWPRPDGNRPLPRDESR